MSLDKGKFETHYKEQMKKALKTADNALQDEISKGLYVKSSRGRMQADLMKDILTGTAIDDVKKLWKKEAKRIIATAKGSEILASLNKTAKVFEERLIGITQITSRYIAEIRRMHGGMVTGKVLLKMRDSRAFKAGEMKELLNNPAAMSAAKYVFKVETQTDAKFKEVKKYLSSTFAAGGPNYNQGAAPSSWILLNFLSGKEKKEALAYHISAQKLTGKKLKEFLKAGSKHGAVSFSLASQLNTGASKFTKGEEHMMGTAYKINHDFVQRAKEYFRPAYGSYNKAAQMLRGKPIMIFLMKLSSVISAGGTLIANVFKDDGWKNPGRIASVMTKKGMLINYGIYALAKHWEDSKPGKFTAAAERRVQDENATAYKLKTLTEGNRGWHTFLTGNKFSGSVVFEEFVNERGRRTTVRETKGTAKGQKKSTKVSSTPIYKRITLPAFVRWLKGKGTKDKRYTRLLAQIKESGDGTFTVNGVETTNDDLRGLAKTFHVWGIKGASVQKSYRAALERASGGAKAPVKKKKT